MMHHIHLMQQPYDSLNVSFICFSYHYFTKLRLSESHASLLAEWPNVSNLTKFS